MKLNRKKTLITSLVVMILCMVLLAGSTYAAFTDTAEATINIGTAEFDMEVYHSEAVDSKPADSAIATKISEETKTVTINIKLSGWKNKFVYFKVVNAGDVDFSASVAHTFAYGDNGDEDPDVFYSITAGSAIPDATTAADLDANQVGNVSLGTIVPASAETGVKTQYVALRLWCGDLESGVDYNTVTITLTFNATSAIA
ncbi:MAG: hypothetical protein J6V68_01205 [Clostridia bacterium]|nr:hypothetical protein [Clostridia bacterium]